MRVSETAFDWVRQAISNEQSRSVYKSALGHRSHEPTVMSTAPIVRVGPVAIYHGTWSSRSPLATNVPVAPKSLGFLLPGEIDAESEEADWRNAERERLLAVHRWLPHLVVAAERLAEDKAGAEVEREPANELI
jgi:hypothetical protein